MLLLGLCWLAAVPSSLSAQPIPIVLDDAAATATPLPHLNVLVDTTGRLTFDDVRQPPHADRFAPAPDGIAVTDAPQRTHWARFTVRRKTSEAASWWLTVRADSVTAFLPHPDGTTTVVRTGFKLAVENRSISRGWPIAMEVPLPPERNQVIYLRLAHDAHSYRTSNRPVVPRLEAAKAARDALTRRDYFQGAFFGVMLALGLYNLFLFFTIRSRPYLHYVLVTLFWALYWMTGLGYHIDFGWPASAPGAYEVNFFVMLGIPIFHVLFTQHFLNTRRFVPRLHHLLTAILVACIGVGLLALGGTWLLAERLAASLALVFAPTVIVVGVLVYRNGYTPARYYLLACAALSVGVVLYTLRWFGVLPETTLTLHSLQIGVVLEAVLFSLALADRIRLLERERNQALEQKSRAEAMTRALRETDELKTQLLGLAAHDLRSPLTNIIGYTDLLQETVPDTMPQESLRAIRRAAHRMSTLLTDLLNTTAIESGAIAFSPAPVDLANVVEGTVEAYQPRAEAKSQDLTLDLPAATTLVHADAERLREALDNLISNAIKFTQHDGDIRVAVLRHNGHARVLVQDNGPGLSPEDQEHLFTRFRRLSARPTGNEPSTGLGLSPEDQEHLFTRFRRLSARPTGNEPSTGLGLAITKHIVDLHDGRIWADSTPGEGTTFVIELALLRAAVGQTA
ncbi:MAG: hypothetical protein GVY18_18240 [Bacteroidetes bacterium]|nr:hypothetical protein [Bacteroidota bacterium]